MSLPFSGSGVASVLALLLAGVAFCQETDTSVSAPDAAAPAATPADPAKKYRDLRNSKDRATKALAERYDDLIGLQEWVDASGQHKIKAKYVAHAPDLAWVKLATVPATGSSQATKESTVPLARLNKASQAKVRQIAALQRKLDELAAAGAADSAALQGAGAPPNGESGFERRERGVARSRAERERPGEEMDASLRGEPTDAGTPLPWQTNYDAFRANFSASKDETGKWKLDYGELKALSPRLGDSSRSAAASPRRATGPANQLEKRLSDVTWEARFKRLRVSNRGHAVEFDLPPLPEPFDVNFTVDAKAGSSAEEWTKFSPGDLVRFRATVHVGGRTIAVLVREPQLLQAAAEGGAPAAAIADTAAAPDNPLEEVIGQPSE